MFSWIITKLGGGFIEPALKKLRNQLLTVNMISLTFVIVIAFSLIYINYYNRTQSDISKSLEAIPPGVLENLRLSQQMADGNDNDWISGGESITISGGPVIPVDYSKSFVVNIDEYGGIVVFSMLDIEEKDYVYAIKTALEKGSSSGALHMADHTWRYNITDISDLSQGVTIAKLENSIVFLDVEESVRGLSSLALSLIIIGTVAIVAILLISLFVANRAIRPVGDSMARQRRFVADASHELKTPIAVIAANAEAAKAAVNETEGFTADDDSAPGVSHWIDNIVDEANHMDNLVRSLLALARSEETEIIAETFDLFEIINEEAARVETFLFEKKIAFIIEPPSQHDAPLYVCSDRIKTKSLLSILFENAVKYTPDGGYVTITAGRSEDPKKPEGKAFIAVSNTGAYIPPEDISQVFDRFFRTDRSRNSETGGYGIGLSIAREIVQSLGGELTAASVKNPDGGAVNTFTLYI